MNTPNDRAAYRYRYAMRECQWVALNLYQAFRAAPTEEGLEMLRVTSQLLREVTHKAKQVPEPRPFIPIIAVDDQGNVVWRSLAP